MNAVTHGPFPIRVFRLIGGVVVALLGGTMTAFVATPDVLSCEARGGNCTFGRAFRDRVQFPRHAFHRVRVQKSVGGKGGPRGEPILELDPSGFLPAHTVSEARALEFAATVEGAFGKAEPFELELRDPPFMLVMTLAMLAAGIGLVYTALRGTGRCRLQLDTERRELLTTRSFVGIPFWRGRVSIAGVDDVVLEWGRIDSPSAL